MKKYVNILLTVVVLGLGSVLTADAQSNRDFRPDHDYYGEEFDWRWDVRVRISDGINSGLITRWEANRLYRKLENVEEKEYAYLADGVYEPWEQDEVWRDVQWLNSRVGLELRDFDRTYYGFNRTGLAFAGYPSWWYNGGYNFYRFDNWGWGNIRRGYAAQCFVPRWVPNRVVYVNNYRNHGHSYYRNDNRRSRVVSYESNTNNGNATRGARSSSRNDRTVYNRNGNNTRRGSAVTSSGSNRSSSVNRSSSRRSATVGSRSITTPNRSTARTRTNSGRSESLNRTSGVNSRSREANRPTTSRSSASTNRSSSREYSRPATSSRSVAPSRSSASRSQSLNRSARSSSVNKSYSRPSSSSKSRSAVSRSSAGRTKAPEASRSTSIKSRSSSSATRSSRREN